VAVFIGSRNCHDSAIEILSGFKKNEKQYKRKKPANPRICRFYHVFFQVFEKIEKAAFLLLLPFLWGEQDSNHKLEARIFPAFLFV